MSDKVRATDLISKAKNAAPRPCSEAMRELRKLVKHNSSVPTSQRINRGKAIDMLRSWGWPHGRDAFNRLIETEYGTTWGKVKAGPHGS